MAAVDFCIMKTHRIELGSNPQPWVQKATQPAFSRVKKFYFVWTPNNHELKNKIFGPDEFVESGFDCVSNFWLNGYVIKQNCRISSEANPQVYVETPLHPEELTVWGALWAGGILLQKQ
ncbi:hypothetical protein TNCV_1070751 [Trichonephila clavipes]|nr:hypothetical protein TNCV_1070751 [Trichonephila clavipes]